MKKKSDKKVSSINHMAGWLAKNIPDLIIESDWLHQEFDIKGGLNSNGVKAFYMVDVKEGWVCTWPEEWKELRISYKNKKVLDFWYKNYRDDLFTFIIFRKDFKKAWHIPADILMNAEVKEVPSTNKAKSELFFHVPVEFVYKVDMSYD